MKTATTKKRTLRWTAAAAALAAGSLVSIAPASANHPVTVEGNCFGPGAGMTATGLRTSPVPPGTCGDYDGDGNIGAGEDGDGDNNYGTIGAALAAVAQNGRVTIVSDGVFPEVVTLNPADGANITLEAAPGVDANIDAVVQGADGNADRGGQPGIIVDGCNACRVVVRNVMTRNWTDGVIVQGASHVALDDVRAEGNTNYGIHVVGSARAVISDSEVNGNGFRKTGAGVSAPNPGGGIDFEDGTQGSIYNTTVSGSVDAGVSAPRRAVELDDVQSNDNNPNFEFSGTAGR